MSGQEETRRQTRNTKTWEHLWVFPEELMEVTRKRVIWASLWKMLPSHDLDPDKKTTMKMIKIIEVENN